MNGIIRQAKSKKILHCSPNTITNVRKSLNSTGEAPEQSKIGRPTKRTPQILGFDIQATLTNPCISGSDLQD